MATASTKEFTLSKPTAKASKGRTYALYCACGVDCRELGLTNKQAHEFLNDANNGKAYHVREALKHMGARAAKQDVAKEHRSDPKPNVKAKPKAKSKGNGDPDVADILALLRERPEILQAFAATVMESDDDVDEDEDVDEDDEEEAAKPKQKANVPVTKAKARAKREPKPKSASPKKKATPKTTDEDDLTITDDELLSFLESSITKAAG